MSATQHVVPGQYREVSDANGRVYRVGETDRSLLGRPRAWMVWLPWIAMMGVSVYEYGYSSAEAVLEHAHGWTLTETFWIASIWAVFQAGVAFPAGRLRETGVLPARTAMLAGAVFSGLGFLALSHLSNPYVVIAGYSVLGGTGAGLVYATCINMVGKWYPDNKGARTGFVNGGFAYGTLPLIFVFNYWFHPSNYKMVLDLIALGMVLVVAFCGMFFRDPPKSWWPHDVDPLNRGVSEDARRVAKRLAKNPPAKGQFTPMEAIRTGQLPLMWFALVCIGGVSLFGINFQVPFAKSLGFGPLVAASSAGVLAVVNGVGRAVVGWLSDYLGRRQTLGLVLVVAGLAQFGVLWSGQAHNEPLFLFFAFLNGFGGGAFYPLFAALTPDYFGENNNAQNYGLVYSAKLVGGVGGGGVAAGVVAAWGYAGAYYLAGGIAFLSALITVFLRQPGAPRRSGDGSPVAEVGSRTPSPAEATT
ncbi:MULTISPECIES: OFA family MFS transporter [Streptomycetaceae]|uniref:OFA family MFS transporter n=1 Tax=Streptomycetaceae TaxID=2062 RepID=UPI00039F4947|nr:MULTISPECIES: OFA family MFS transporter [Streptomycetaceae]MYX38033.1 MFS transporter [Streptomyces sp. SID8377]